MNPPGFEPAPARPRVSPKQSLDEAQAFLERMRTRRTIRDFSDEPLPLEAVKTAIAVAGLAPSGANRQPWHFALVTSGEIKRRIRLAAEEEEKAFYGGRAGEDWLAALEPFGTTWQKPFLETAPCLIIVFQENYGLGPGGERIKNYYIQESVGIACGMLLTALHLAGFATLTHTPSPMGFLREICARPMNEKAVMVIVVGYAAEGATVPTIGKKPLSEICSVL